MFKRGFTKPCVSMEIHPYIAASIHIGNSLVDWMASNPVFVSSIGRPKMSTALYHAARACNAETVEFLLAWRGGAAA